MTRPMRLAYTQMPHIYRGGERLARFRSAAPPTIDHAPEEWLGSTVTRFGDGELGLSRLDDGRTLVDHIREDHGGWLGESDAPGMLVKLIDAGERLPVHCHPDRAFASERLGAVHGKAEAWAILEADAGSTVWVGFARDISRDELEQWFAGQDQEAFLQAMNRIEVAPGDIVFVPPGVVHAVGEGILFLEVQEPSDFSIFLEWQRFVPDERTATLGLDVAVALDAVRRERSTPAELARWHARPAAGQLARLPSEAEEYFRLDWAGAGEASAAGFRVLAITEGAGELAWASGRELTGRGDCWAVPAVAGAARLRGDGIQGIWASA